MQMGRVTENRVIEIDRTSNVDGDFLFLIFVFRQKREDRIYGVDFVSL